MTSSPLKIAMTLSRAGDTPSGRYLSPFSRMLNGAEKSQVVGRGLKAADFARERAAQKLARPATARAFDRNGVDAVILGERAWRAVGRFIWQGVKSKGNSLILSRSQ